MLIRTSQSQVSPVWPVDRPYVGGLLGALLNSRLGTDPEVTPVTETVSMRASEEA